MKPMQTIEEGPDGEKLTETQLMNGRTSTIIHVREWTDSVIICWGGLRLGGQVTVHLVSELVPYGGTLGGLAACMPKWGPNVIWTFDFGFKSWEGAILCKNCFEVRKGAVPWAPKTKKMPKEGWFTYGVKPKIELKKNKKAAAVEALLAVPPPKAVMKLINAVVDGDGRRIVEI